MAVLAAPSAPGKHLDKIKALRDGQWLDLGAPAPDPKWGKARGRSWCSVLVIVQPATVVRWHRQGFCYYRCWKSHGQLADYAPFPREIEPPPRGCVVAEPLVGGLHHRYRRVA